MLLELQRAEDLALRGGRGGEGDDEVCDAARHILPSRPTQNAGAYRGRLIGEIIAFGQALIKTERCGAIWRGKKDLTDAQASSTRRDDRKPPTACVWASGNRLCSWPKPVLMLPRTRLYVSFYHVSMPTRDLSLSANENPHVS